MCGRFAAVRLGKGNETAEFLREEVQGWPEGGFGFKDGGDVFPGDTVPVIVRRGRTLGALPMKWGFPGYPDPARPGRKPRPLINARSETAASLATWRGPLKTGRCLVPAEGFYEWQRGVGRATRKWRFRAEDGGMLFLAGLLRDNPGAPAGQAPLLFAVLTAAANASMADVHDRMPVCVPRPLFGAWLGTGYLSVLETEGVPFSREPA
ncbi:MAG: SOS response-associated peptidase [Deltaproteobacteria bacterium]|jgi:putative SOS response-associated peptidase YedK|nr:SOS response-associated peptidase [Deltaproteobacteria bacterium]